MMLVEKTIHIPLMLAQRNPSKGGQVGYQWIIHKAQQASISKIDIGTCEMNWVAVIKHTIAKREPKDN